MSGEDAEPGFRHEALLYAGEDAFLAGAMPFIEAAAEDDEAVLVAVGLDKIALLAGEIDYERVLYADISRVGRNPACIIPLWQQFVSVQQAQGRGVRGIGEPVHPGRSDAELIECRHHEALLNLAFADSSAWSLLCPYDTEALNPEEIEVAHRTHPLVAEDGVSRENPAFETGGAPNPFEGPLSDPGAEPDQLPFTLEGLGSVRSFVGQLADASGLGRRRSADLVLAVDELATNSVRHAGGTGTVRAWREHGALLCEVRDGGRIEDPMAGRIRPSPQGGAGRGLWLVNQVCDLVQIRASEQGNTVRLHMTLD